MKSLYLVFITTIFLVVSCDKNSESPLAKNFEGTWIIKKSYADPGDGSGRYTDVPGSPTITFHSGGTVSSDFGNFGLGMVDSFQVVDSVKIRFSFKDHSSQPSTTYRYSFSRDTLILNPPCIEGCGLKLVRK